MLHKRVSRFVHVFGIFISLQRIQGLVLNIGNSLLVGEMRVLKKVTRTVILNFPWQPRESVKTAGVIFHF